MKKLITVADWVGDSLAQEGVKISISGYLQNSSGVDMSFVRSNPSTFHTGFLVGQLANFEESVGHPLETIIFQSTDLRQSSYASIERTKGSPFFVVRLTSGLYLCGPNAGYNYSFVRDSIQKVYLYSNFDKEVKFRSRDAYSRVVAHLIDYLEDDLDLEEVHLNQIQGIQGFHVGHVDNHGNITTTVKMEDLKGRYELGETVKISMHGVSRKVRYLDNLFAGEQGELVLYQGSFGHTDNPFLDIGVWKDYSNAAIKTAAQIFNNPVPGNNIEI
jgi:hypothetical protein